MSKALEVLINDKLNAVVQKNSTYNYNLIMRFRILKKIKSVKETYILYQKKRFKDNAKVYSVNRVNSLVEYLDTVMEMTEIQYEDLYYSPLENGLPHTMNFFTSWFYENDDGAAMNRIHPVRDEIIWLVQNYTSNHEIQYFTIKEEPSDLIEGNCFSSGYHLFVCIEEEVLMFEFSVYD